MKGTVKEKMKQLAEMAGEVIIERRLGGVEQGVSALTWYVSLIKPCGGCGREEKKVIADDYDLGVALDEALEYFEENK